VDKGSGLRTLCDLLGVEIGRVIAVGDSDNDIPMLRAAGLGVAMGNANARVKAVADWIAPSLDEDGVAATIHQWVLAPHSQRA
jgi:hydroxymethylpyrimidine pyrophosphatase-like HAD family hydrolase